MDELHDVFICHASEDKAQFVRPLAEALREHNVVVWYDEFSLKIGDSLSGAIERGLKTSRFAIVVLSNSFFSKKWPRKELNSLFAREIRSEHTIILPVWHEVEFEDVMEFSPLLADSFAIRSNNFEKLIDSILKKIQPVDSPLIVARDLLLHYGVSPPVISDEWWLDIVEIKQAQFMFPDPNMGWWWIFPLPHGAGDTGKKRGVNIAWSALQNHWAREAERIGISHLSRPETVQEFIASCPGLLECATANPVQLALYAPQLTIPGFDTGFEDVFDQLLGQDFIDVTTSFSYGKHKTIDGCAPSCGDIIAWRDPDLGNYMPAELAYSFANASTPTYSRSHFDGFACLFWLLSPLSDWMPRHIQETLVRGYKERTFWWFEKLVGQGSSLSKAYYGGPRSLTRYSKSIETELQHLVMDTSKQLQMQLPTQKVVDSFLQQQFFEASFEDPHSYGYRKRIAKPRRGK